MAKRARGSVRPGQRRPIDRKPASPAPVASSTASAAPRPSGLTEAEEARAAEQEYAYVARDLRDIGRMAIIMLVILFGLWYLIDVARVIPIG